MPNQSLLKIIFVTCLLIITVPVCFAETVEQTNHLFKITLPTGWRWSEQAGRVRISDPQTGNAISIQFAPSGKHSTDEIKELLKNGNQKMIERVVKPSNGTVVKDEEREIGGLFARQLTFLVSHAGETGNMTYISTFHGDYAFTITFGGPDKDQVAEMKKSVETLQFE